MTGIIKILNTEKGFGFIRDTNGKEYFFHRSALKNVNIEDLRKNQEVTFEETDSAKGPRAEDVYA